MKLSDILQYDRITIQCHDNPDADTIATGYALYTYLQDYKKDVTLIYGGMREIQKDNLRLMIEELEIPIVHCTDNTGHVDGLLVTVDCQYGANNVTKFEADDVMIIDHHPYEIDNIDKTYIDSSKGSCSTVMWQLLGREKFNFDRYPRVQTALYYGLYTDTAQFMDITNPIDRDMQDELCFDKDLVHRLMNANISERELAIAGVAMIRATINHEMRFAIVKVDPCDPNILGLISDFVLQVSGVDLCVVYNTIELGIKFSVRSCVKESKANHVAQYLTREIGSGGGHLYKAGGFIDLKQYMEVCGNFEPGYFFATNLQQYLTAYEILDARKQVYDVTGSRRYRKKAMKVGYVRASDILPVGEEALIRTLEGDLHLKVDEDTYIMIGIKGEIYPTSGANFIRNYQPVDEPYDLSLQYLPKAKILGTDRDIQLLDYVRSCITNDSNEIYARVLTKGVKIFTPWDRECYIVGEPGDYIVCKCENLKNMYVIEQEIFGLSYEAAED